MVQEAYDTGWNRSVFERAWRRAFNQPLNIEIGLAYSMDQETLKGKLQTIAKEVNQEPKSASLTSIPPMVNLPISIPARGRKVDVDASVVVVELGAVRSPQDQKSPELAVAITRAGLSTTRLQTVLVVDVMSNSLKYYNKDTLVNTYNVATGAPRPTPWASSTSPAWKHDPVWINPGSEWAKDMPPTIPRAQQPPWACGAHGHQRGGGDGAHPRTRPHGPDLTRTAASAWPTGPSRTLR